MANSAAGQQATSDNSLGMQLIKGALAARVKNLSTIMTKNMKSQLDFCIENDVLGACGIELKFYSTSLLEVTDESSTARSSNYLKPNKNCNLSSWISGCEPGWACSAGKDTKIDFENDKEMPSRTLDCQSCCEGFFCPHGLTCMIPCPMGAYCPLSKTQRPLVYVINLKIIRLPLSTSSWRDRSPPCGGADVWADFMSATELFCSAGFYCPTTVQKIPCSKGYLFLSQSSSFAFPCKFSS
ncbi:hypothetical protein HAX54_009623 [Datura stramonium]|uniref:Uncharacterized protein n=1 Tax=Datura stramonium TaxID=4076 RepID=A0ABS8TF11_DATST|nr:hypothetical protein [Datura stramonium]